MMADVYNDTWASLVVWSRDVLRSTAGTGFHFIDWETHASLEELPNENLAGPLALSVSEYEEQMFQVNFSIGVSTYTSDPNLFKLRQLVGEFFKRMRGSQQIPYFDSSNSMEKSVMVMTPSSTVAPMNKSEIRPFQYVQGSALLVPYSTL